MQKEGGGYVTMLKGSHIYYNRDVILLYPSHFICKMKDSLFLSDTNEMKVKMGCYVTGQNVTILCVLVCPCACVMDC